MRMKGLLGRTALEPGESLWIRPCNSIHTVGMKFPIDVVFLDSKNVVIAVKKHFPPHRLTRIYFRAASVLELAAGAIEDAGIEIGDRFDIS